jgi:PAS domain S-box-containing protein
MVTNDIAVREGAHTNVSSTDVFDASPNPYLLLGPDFTILEMNSAYLEVTGRRREDILGRTMFDAFPAPSEDSERQLRESLERAIRTGQRDTLPLIKYDIAMPGPDGPVFEERFWSATHTPLLSADGSLRAILQHTVDVTELHRLRERDGRTPGSVGAEGDVLRRAQAAEKEKGRLEAERRRLEELFQQAPGFIAVLSGPDHVFELANAAYGQLVGGRQVVGRPVAEALPEVVAQGFVELLNRVVKTGEPFHGRRAPVRLQRRPGAEPEEVFLDFLYQPIRDHHGKAIGVFVQGHDVTEAVRTEQRRRLLVDELNHRVKNTLATVQSIAAQTARTAPDPAAFRVAFDARLKALSHTHDLLTREHWEGADLKEVLAHEVTPFGEGRVQMAGPPVRLPPRAALSLGMVVHELSTNAAKYGALSASGRVAIDWTVDESKHLRLAWTEAGGPEVKAPSRRGFGSRLISRSISYELNGEAEVDFHPSGLRARFAIPLLEETV